MKAYRTEMMLVCTVYVKSSSKEEALVHFKRFAEQPDLAQVGCADPLDELDFVPDNRPVLVDTANGAGLCDESEIEEVELEDA